MIRFASLGSGSAGNALLVESGKTRLLVDCGFGPRQAEARLARLGLSCADLTGILVTHEHTDHAGGVYRLARRHRLPVWLTHGTLAASAAASAEADCRLIDSHTPLSIGDLEVTPYPVPHDAREPVQYVFSDGALRLGLLTDAGEITLHMRKTLKHCDGLVLECNHDPAMLAASSYPPSLRRRVAGRLGHLSNDTAATLLSGIDTRRLQHLVAAHLSRENNRPALVRQALAEVLGGPEDICIADQEEGFGWRQLRY